MGKGNPFPFKLFLELWLPRLIALAILGYLAYSLFFRQDQFSWLHITALLIATALILAPMASRLKISNLIDFNSKLDGLEREQQETKNQLNELRNQISTAISMRVSPVQVVSFEGARDLLLAAHQATEQLAVNTSTHTTAQDTKEQFLRRVSNICGIAFPILILARSFQVTINEHRIFVSDIPQSYNQNESLKHLVTSILEHDLTTIVPLVLRGQDDQKAESVVTPEVLEGLKQLPYLVDLYQQVKSGEQELTLLPHIDALLDKVSLALATIGGVLDVLGSHAILYKYEAQTAIKALLDKIDIPDADQTSPSTTPPNCA
jgi:hypothetical protein